MRKFAWIALAAVCPSAFGWGVEGHALIVRIAEAQLTARARDQIAAILGPGKTLVSVASWADEIRRSRPETGPWHYVDIPIDRPHLDMARDCPKGECVIARIEDFEKVVANQSAPAGPSVAKRSCSWSILSATCTSRCTPRTTRTRAATPCMVQLADRRLNLHSLWDGALLARMGNEDQLAASWTSGLGKALPEVVQRIGGRLGGAVAQGRAEGSLRKAGGGERRRRWARLTRRRRMS